jgi:hypothetical protein
VARSTQPFDGFLNMAMVRLDTSSITDWDSFHRTCRDVFGFPDFYGMNMNAWIDCLTYLDEGDGMSRFHLAPNETLNIEVSDTESFKSRLPEIFDALVVCSADVNQRYLQRGKAPLLSLVFV